MKRNICIAVVGCLFAAALFGQSAQRLDQILEAKEATFGQAAYLMLTAGDSISDTADFKTAFDELKNVNPKWIPDSVSEADIIPLGTYALLLMQTFDIKGGLMYRMYPCARYAYRDLRYLAVIQGKTDPSDSVTGVSMLQMFGRIETVQGGEK
mgnify:CR=1 FL=1